MDNWNVLAAQTSSQAIGLHDSGVVKTRLLKNLVKKEQALKDATLQIIPQETEPLSDAFGWQQEMLKYLEIHWGTLTLLLILNP
uniref:GG11666 n=1 Tax=Drosophila erecta TaxID=7220 RepID=B3P5H1_DROER